MKLSRIATVLIISIGLALAFFGIAEAGAFVDMGSFAFAADSNPLLPGLALAGIGNIDDAMKPVMTALDGLEAKMTKYAEKADLEAKESGKVSTETKSAIDALGIKQRELADEILQIKQRSSTHSEADAVESMGQQFVKSDRYADFVGGGLSKMRLELKNTVTNTVGNSFSERQPGIVSGSARIFTLEQLLTTLPTRSSSVDYVKENVFTNSAAEAAEGAAKAESSITTTLVSEPVATIAHWLKISKQLAADNAALAAYINTRLVYGVNLRVENQIIQGTGVAPNISGFTKAGNFTAHGYTAASLAALGLLNNRFDLIGKMLGDLMAADYPADAIVLNPGDWWTIRLAKDSQNRYILGDPGTNVAPSLFGVPVVASNAVTVDNVLVASLAQAATFYNREGVTVEMSDSDSDNFTKNLITVRAERRALLAVERPAAVRYGDLTPA